MGNWKLGIMIFGILAALGFHVRADYLTTPIQGKAAGELSSEMANSMGHLFLPSFLKHLINPMN
ncbi:hypothetical protein LCL89_14160 [Halobacillus yeomjeoni]|uniref:hypothetical protein n=1 Tax=Halobacillus yeomjeoni TaxID=311194 RepID=UPI001CD5E236|nr:hypothetical protein [Halobacillus yeomjeoni]MCA0985172.1 hypothetical protein [Halobacillus yeomjeoni]